MYSRTTIGLRDFPQNTVDTSAGRKSILTHCLPVSAVYSCKRGNIRADNSLRPVSYEVDPIFIADLLSRRDSLTTSPRWIVADSGILTCAIQSVPGSVPPLVNNALHLHARCRQGWYRLSPTLDKSTIFSWCLAINVDEEMPWLFLKYTQHRPYTFWATLGLSFHWPKLDSFNNKPWWNCQTRRHRTPPRT